MQKVFDFYEDAGHGWMKVKKELLSEMRIADKITEFSYERGEYAYLEEDCDLTTFCRTYKAMYGEEFKVKTHYSKRSAIRDYDCYGENK